MNDTATHYTVLSLPFSLDGREELRLAVVRERRLAATASAANWGAEAVTLFQVFVAEGERGRGLGRELVETACRMARDNGAIVVSAVVEEGGPLEFWEKLGFRTAHLEGNKRIVTRFLESA